MKARTPPRSVRILNQWVDAHARQLGQPSARVRNWLSYIVLGGALETAGFEGEGRKFTIKGGVALELRLRHLARATKDLDLILNSSGGDLIQELEGALSRSYQGFAFRLKGQPELMPNGATRVEISLQYLGKAWGTVQVDVARHEGDGAEIEMVEAISLAPFGLIGPDTLPCLSLPYHIAQKIHAMTLPAREGRRNERFRDLVDLLLIREWVTDFEAVKLACEKVFATRATHAWPPFPRVPEHWVAPFERMALDLGLGISDLYQAVLEIRQFINQIDSSAEWLSDSYVSGRITATTWYFVVGADRAIHRIPSELGEALCTADENQQLQVPLKWQMEPGGVVLIGVVMLLQNRKPLFIERASVMGIALVDEMAEHPLRCGSEVWIDLARSTLERANAPLRALQALGLFLSRVQGDFPVQIGLEMGIGPKQMYKYVATPRTDQLLWNVWESQPVRRLRKPPTG